MGTLIILDTNIITGKNPAKIETLREQINNYSELGDVYITETVLDEFSVHYYRFLDDVIIPSLKDYKFVYDSIGLSYEFSDLSKKRAYENIWYFIRDLFKNNIIPLNLDSIEIDQIYKRALRKEPPFTHPKKDGDSGFKDTLIWLSILNYDYGKYEEIIFVTTDRDFRNNRNDLEKIFIKKHEKTFKIYDEHWQKNQNKIEVEAEADLSVVNENEVGEDVGTTDDVDQLLEDYEEISSFRTKLEELLEEIILMPINPFDTSYAENPFISTYSQHQDYRFHIHEYIKIQDFTFLKRHLLKIISDSGLLSGIRAEVFLSPFLDEQNVYGGHRIDTDSLKELLNIMNDFEKKLPNYTESFLVFVNDKINTIAYRVLEDELPF